MKINILIITIMLMGCVQKQNTVQDKPINDVLGQSALASVSSIKVDIVSRLKEATIKANNCNSPTIINTKIVKASKWDTTNNPPMLTGKSIELWDIDSCGKNMQLMVVVSPVKDKSGRFVIGTALKEI